MVKKLLIIFTLFCLFFFACPKSALAEGEFITDSQIEYKVDISGKTSVKQTITLENLFTNYYAASYKFILENIKPENIRAFQAGQELKFKEKEENGQTLIEVFFDQPAIGRGRRLTFNLMFDNLSISQKTGEVWEISIPRLSSPASFRAYEVRLIIPDSLGKEAYISPQPSQVTHEGSFTTYVFSKNDVGNIGITAAFGDFQVFTFELNYHLENPLKTASSVQIAVPPDTSLQKVYLQSLDPKPLAISADSDGNWLATYKLKARQRIDIKLRGSVQIFSAPRSYPLSSEANLAKNLEATEFWQADDIDIKSLALNLATPKKIYDYVSQNLVYNYDRVKPNALRLSAKGALLSPQNATCMEFTDLFIALARAANIPAREINGYAYTENPQIQPLSLVADVLHAWPEYWDNNKKVWVAVDPTWGATTGGIDFFNKLDLRHFTFVKHGENPTKPYAPGSYKLGANPQKDVFVSFGSLPENRVSHPKITFTQKHPLPFSALSIKVKLTNPGPVALYDQLMTTYFDKNLAAKDKIDLLLPYGSSEKEIKIPFSLFGSTIPNFVKIQLADRTVDIPTDKTQAILYNLISLFLIFIIICLSILLKLKRLNPFRLIRSACLKVLAFFRIKKISK